MRTKFHILIIFLLSTLFSQNSIDNNWINVAGKSERQIKSIIHKEIDKQVIKSPNFVVREKNKLEESNENKKIAFQRKKLNLRIKLNQSSDQKQSAKIQLINSKDIANSTFSDFRATQQQIADLDSSILENNRLIRVRKKEMEDKLSNIPLHDLIISITYNTKGRNSKNYDSRMDNLS